MRNLDLDRDWLKLTDAEVHSAFARMTEDGDGNLVLSWLMWKSDPDGVLFDRDSTEGTAFNLGVREMGILIREMLQEPAKAADVESPLEGEL